MAHTAAHLVDRVLPHVGIRQWVLTLPYPLRYRCAYDARLTSDVLRAFVRALFASLRSRARRAARAGDAPPTQCGAVTFVQRFGSALNLNLHFHTLALDGAYRYKPRPGAAPITFGKGPRGPARGARADTPYHLYSVMTPKPRLYFLSAGLGIAGSLLALVVGFFPPEQLTSTGLRPRTFIGFLTLGLLLSLLVPLVVFHFRRPEWRGIDAAPP